MPLTSRSNEDAQKPPKPPKAPRKRVVLSGHTPGNVAAPPNRRLVVGKASQPIGSANGLATVLGDDERSRIRDTEDAPFRMVCALDIRAPWGSAVGTGWLAGPRTVVTAGHCVHDTQKLGGWATEIVVTPGQDGSETPAFSRFTSRRFASVERWLDARDPDFDIGVIHLDEPVGETVGWFSVAALPDRDLADALVNVSGYPSSPGSGTQQWWAMNRVRALAPRRVFYDVDTSGGQSGGPVYLYEDAAAAPIVVAIHAYGTGGTPSDVPLVVNSAPRIVPEVVEQIRAWIAESDALAAAPPGEDSVAHLDDAAAGAATSSGGAATASPSAPQ